MTELWIVLTLWATGCLAIHLVWRAPHPQKSAAAPVICAGSGVEVLAQTARSACPALQLAPTSSPVFSKFGGLPGPEIISWPIGAEAPRTFVAQISLTAVRACGGPDWLTKAGNLYVFHDRARRGFPDEILILTASPSRGASETAQSLDRLLPEQHLSFRPFTSLPSLEWLGVDHRTLDIDVHAYWEGLDQIAGPPPDGPRHRIGGYPEEINGGCLRLTCERLVRGWPEDADAADPPDVIAASEEWRLLLQLDTDRTLDMDWGWDGRLYVFIREQHSRAGDFSKTVTIWQGR